MYVYWGGLSLNKTVSIKHIWVCCLFLIHDSVIQGHFKEGTTYRSPLHEPHHRSLLPHAKVLSLSNLSATPRNTGSNWFGMWVSGDQICLTARVRHTLTACSWSYCSHNTLTSLQKHQYDPRWPKEKVLNTTVKPTPWFHFPALPVSTRLSLNIKVTPKSLFSVDFSSFSVQQFIFNLTQCW